MVNLALGSFYRITYSQWKTNPRVTAFVLWPGIVGGNKVHILNLSAIQLSAIDRIRLMQVLKRLITASQKQSFTGRQLYNILKTYAPGAIRSCYRTMWRQYVTNYALVNYGLNSKEFFDKNPILLQRNNKQLYDLAAREFMIKSLNFMTNKGADFKFANVATPTTPKPTIPTTNQPQPTQPTSQPKFFEPTIKPTLPQNQPNQPAAPENNETNNNEDDNNIF